jgi:hypothetical protein
MKKTVEELLQELSHNKEYLKQKKAREKKRRILEKKLKCDEKPIIKDLFRVGIHVKSVWDLVNTREPYPEALPVLLAHLTRNYHPKTLAGISRALGVPEAINDKAIWDTVVDLYLKTGTDESIKPPEMRGLKEGLAVAISNLCTKERLDLVIDLIKDEKHGESRGLIVYGLRRFRKDPKVKELLKSLSNDPVLGRIANDISKASRNKSKQTKN